MPIPWQKRPLISRGSFPMRPLDKGIDLSIPPQLIPSGGFLDIYNYFSTKAGLKRMAGWNPYTVNTANSLMKGFPQRMIHTYDTNQVQISLVITSDAIYRIASVNDALQQVYYDDPYIFSISWNKAAKTITTSATLTDPSMLDDVGAAIGAVPIRFDTTLQIKQGDMIRLMDGITQVCVWVNSISVDGLTINYTIVTAAPYASATAPDGTPLANFNSGTGSSSIWTVRRALHQFTSGAFPVQQINGWNYGTNLFITAQGIPLGQYSALSNSFQSASPVTPTSYKSLFLWNSPNITWLAFSAAVGTFFKAWMWLGNILDVNGVHPQRVVWSNPFAVITDWSDPINYIDIPSTPGRLVQMLPNNEQLIIYAEDAVYYGYNSNLPDLPLTFQAYDTGGIGAANGRAVAAVQNGHFFVGLNNIYFLEANGITPVGTPIIRDSINQCQNIQGIQAFHDIANHAVFFGFPSGTDNGMDNVWCFEYLTKSWSRFGKPCYFFGSDRAYSGFEWSDLSGYGNWNPGMLAVPSWLAFSSSLGDFRLFSDNSQILQLRQPVSQPIPSTKVAASIFITPDIDMNSPDIIKSWLRFSLVIADYLVNGQTTRDALVSFDVWHSIDNGNNWIFDDTMIIAEGQTEGYVNFRAVSEKIRFKLITDSLVPQITVEQCTVDVAQAGPNQSVKTQGG